MPKLVPTLDRINGHYYADRVSSAPSMMLKWRYHTTGRRANPQTYRNPARGASSLRDTALRSCCWNVWLFAPEALEVGGWWYAEMIYRRLKETDTLHFVAWSLFQATFPDQAELSHQFSVPKNYTAISWPSIVQNLSLLETSAITLSCAPGPSSPLRHLLSLTAVPNLTALMHLYPLQDHPEPLTTSDLRVWTRAVQEKNALPALKVLALPIVADDVRDSTVLRHLSSLPALHVVAIAKSFLARPARQPRPGGDEPQRSNDDADWEPLDRPRNTAFSDILYGRSSHSRLSLAQRAELLCASASADSVAEGEKGKGPVIDLSLTCYGEGALYRDNAGDVEWFVRRRPARERGGKRMLGPTPSREEEEEDKGAKKRKVKKARKQDLGALLGSFG